MDIEKKLKDKTAVLEGNWFDDIRPMILEYIISQSTSIKTEEELRKIDGMTYCVRWVDERITTYQKALNKGKKE